MLKKIILSIVIASLVLVYPISVSAHSYEREYTPTYTWEPISERCYWMRRWINWSREPNLRANQVLCNVAARRAYDMARNGTFYHDLRPVHNALRSAGVCYKVVGEVLAWWSGWEDSHHWVYQWRTMGAKTHWPLLVNSDYDRGGGGYTGTGKYNVAVFYVLDSC